MEVSVIDEIRVLRDVGEVEVRIIPPDSLCAAPDVLEGYSLDSPIGQELVRKILELVGRQLKLVSPIVSAVHGGETHYTIATADGGISEVDISVVPAVADAFAEAALIVERSVILRPNKLVGSSKGRSRTTYRMETNRIPAFVGCTCTAWRYASPAPGRATAGRPVPANAMPGSAPRIAPVYRRPNRGVLEHES